MADPYNPATAGWWTGRCQKDESQRLLDKECDLSSSASQDATMLSKKNLLHDRRAATPSRRHNRSLSTDRAANVTLPSRHDHADALQMSQSTAQGGELEASVLVSKKAPYFFVSRVLFLTALFVCTWLSLPFLLCPLVDTLLALEPSSRRSFAVACFKSPTQTPLVTDWVQDLGDMGKEDSMDVAQASAAEQTSACLSLLRVPTTWSVLPTFKAFLTILNAHTMCSLEVLRFVGLGPLLPPISLLQKRLRHLGLLPSAISFMSRLSHEPIHPPCEQWVYARATTNKKGMLHTNGSLSTINAISAAESFDFIVVGGGTAGSTLAGLLGRLKRPEEHGEQNDKGASGRPQDEMQSDRRRARVLVLEAGGWPDIRSFSPLKIPARTFEAQKGLMDWGLKTTKQQSACKGLEGGRSFWPRGKVLGGCSWLNYMLYVRGNPRDFDSFSRCAGDKRWEFRRLLKIFKGFEAVQFPADSAFRGTEGPIPVNLQKHVDPTVLAFLRSSEGFQPETEKNAQTPESVDSNFYSVNPDYNGERQSGPSLFQYNTDRGMRLTPLEAFLFHVRGTSAVKLSRKRLSLLSAQGMQRDYGSLWVFFSYEQLTQDHSEDASQDDAPALSVVFHARVIKILFEPTEACDISSKRQGLKLCRRGARWSYEPAQKPFCPLRAKSVLVVDEKNCSHDKWEKEMCEVFEVPVTGELILTAGTVHTPQLLLQSGVGDVTTMKQMGIPAQVNLPGVGRNLQDHIFSPRTFLLKDKVSLSKFAREFPSSARAAASLEKLGSAPELVERLQAYASSLHTDVSLELQQKRRGERSSACPSSKKDCNAAESDVELLVKTANDKRGRDIATIWKYLVEGAGLLASPGAEAHVITEHFGSLQDTEDSTAQLPSSCPPGSPVPDIQLHFINGLPDAAFMTSRLNLPDWFPFFIGTPEKWGGSPHARTLRGVVIMPVLLHPRSRGSIALRASSVASEGKENDEIQTEADSSAYINPMSPPIIDPRYLSSERDVAALIKGFLMIDKISTSGPFAVLVEEELLPECKPEVWRQLFTNNAFTGKAYVGFDKDSNHSAGSSEGKCHKPRSDECVGADCVLASLAADIAWQHPELARVDPVLPGLCALAHARKSGQISVEQWASEFIRFFTGTLYHPVGTCKMGKPNPQFLKKYSRQVYSDLLLQFGIHQTLFSKIRISQYWLRRRLAARGNSSDGEPHQQSAMAPPWSETAVVDGALRLCGGLCIRNVRIADASVLPHLPSGNTHVPTILVAHVAAEDIAKEWLLQASAPDKAH